MKTRKPLIISDNAVTLPSDSGNNRRSAVVNNFDPSFADQFAEFELRSIGLPSTLSMPQVRTDPDNASGTWYGLAFTGAGSWQIRKRVDGTQTTLLTTTWANPSYPVLAKIEALPSTDKTVELFILTHIDDDHIGGGFFKDAAFFADHLDCNRHGVS